MGRHRDPPYDEVAFLVEQRFMIYEIDCSLCEILTKSRQPAFQYYGRLYN